MIIPPNTHIVKQLADAGNDEATSSAVQVAAWRMAWRVVAAALAVLLVGGAILYAVVKLA